MRFGRDDFHFASPSLSWKIHLLAHESKWNVCESEREQLQSENKIKWQNFIFEMAIKKNIEEDALK